MTFRFAPACCFAATIVLSGAVRAHDCDIDGVAVNSDNGATYAGKTGVMTCRDGDGKVIREHELRDGEFIGLDRSIDLWGNKIERSIDANGNSDGRYRAWYPDGTLKSESMYAGGDLVGVSKSFHKNGQLERVSFYAKPGERAASSVEYDANGKLRGFTCGERSHLEQDAALCGFGGKRVTSELYRNNRIVARVTYVDGVLVREETLDENGAVASVNEAAGAGESATDVRRTFHPNGQLAKQVDVANGYAVRERTWYMNGKLQSDTTREPKDRDARITEQRFRDDGTLATSTVALDRRTLKTEHYDKAGKLAELVEHAPEGYVERRRKYAADGSVTLDERYYPDGSKKE